jgi:hypothetical protein
MADRRRSGAPDLLKGTLGTLIRTTLQQVGAMTDAAREQAGDARRRFDDAMLERRRQAALAELGLAVHDLAATGRLGPLAEDPALARALERVDALDAERTGEGDRPRPGSAREAWSSIPRSSAPRPAGDVWRPPREVPIVGEDDDADLADFMHADDLPPRR